MKRKVFALLLCILAFVLTACNAFSNSPDTDEEENPSDNGGVTAADSDLIYGKGVDTVIVKPADEKIDLFPLADLIYALSGEIPVINTDSTSPEAREIVFGDTSREISKKAKTLLTRYIEDDGDAPEDDIYSYFAVYSDGKSVSVVWSDENSKGAAIEYFSENYIKSDSLKLDGGYFMVNRFSVIEVMREKEAEEKALAYKEIGEKFGEEVVSAIKKHLSLYDERFYLWLSDLYDPGEYDEEGNAKGGGFYYSNSARDNEGYFIDIESTKQALGFLESSGMLRGYNNNYIKAFPEKMQKEMVAFALSLQSSDDGYFYHPQWGTAITAGRLSRDVGNSTTVLRFFGEKPYWNTPSGVSGQFGDPPGVAKTSLSDRLEDKSSVVAVSKVVDVASSRWPDRLKSYQNWVDYLEGFADDMKTKSYSIGHNIAEQSAQIKTREAEALANGERGGYIEYTKNFFNRYQNKENGLWEKEISYASVNGLMKIMALYNNLGIKLNHASLAYSSAVEIILLNAPDVNGKTASNSVDVYNPWISLTRINTNIKNYGDASEVELLRKNLQENALEMIKVTTEKTAKFKKADGSFGYTQSTSPAKSQGAPVAVPNTVEGDVNGGTIALVGVTNNMFGALGISGLYIYDPSDFEIFIKRTASHSNVCKNPPKELGTYDFEDEAVGETNPFGVETNLTDGFVEVVERDGGKALKMTTVNDKGDAFAVGANGASGEGCYTLEFDVKFEEIHRTQGTALQIKVGNAYMLTVGVNTAGTFTLGDSSATSSAAITNGFAGSYDALAWHRIKIEHYRYGDSPVTLVYVDSALVARSENYLGSEGGTLPAAVYSKANFYALFSTDLSVLFDNIITEFDDSTPPKTEEESYEGVFDFENTELGQPSAYGIEVIPNADEGSTIEVAEDGKNKALRISAKSSSSAGNWVNIKAADGDGDIYLYETDVKIENLTRSDETIQIFFKSAVGKNIFAVNLKLTKVDGGYTVLVYEKNSGNSRKNTIVKIDEAIDGWFNLKIEYDPRECSAVVTLNGESGTTDAYYTESSKADALGTVSFYTTFSTNCDVYIDNIKVKK